jgi:hypothetical protein
MMGKDSLEDLAWIDYIKVKLKEVWWEGVA